MKPVAWGAMADCDVGKGLLENPEVESDEGNGLVLPFGWKPVGCVGKGLPVGCGARLGKGFAPFC